MLTVMVLYGDGMHDGMVVMVVMMLIVVLLCDDGMHDGHDNGSDTRGRSPRHPAGGAAPEKTARVYLQEDPQGPRGNVPPQGDWSGIALVYIESVSIFSSALIAVDNTMPDYSIE